jgi:hypothetical protein
VTDVAHEPAGAVARGGGLTEEFPVPRRPSPLSPERSDKGDRPAAPDENGGHPDGAPGRPHETVRARRPPRIRSNPPG